MYALCPQIPSFLVPRPQSAKRSKKGYGEGNVAGVERGGEWERGKKEGGLRREGEGHLQ